MAKHSLLPMSSEMWNAAANEFIKQSRVDFKMWSSSLGYGWRLNCPHCMKITCRDV